MVHGTVQAMAGLVLCRARPNAPRRTGDDMQRELVERAQSGDHEAFSVLVRTSYPRLYGVANLVLRDRDRAQDAVQDALVVGQAVERRRQDLSVRYGPGEVGVDHRIAVGLHVQLDHVPPS